MSNDLIPSVTSMTSLEIAELTGKRHADVLRDIRSLLSKLYDLKDGADLHHKEIQGVRIDRDARGYIAVINLDKDHTLTLLTGYSAAQRADCMAWLNRDRNSPTDGKHCICGRKAA